MLFPNVQIDDFNYVWAAKKPVRIPPHAITVFPPECSDSEYTVAPSPTESQFPLTIPPKKSRSDFCPGTRLLFEVGPPRWGCPPTTLGPAEGREIIFWLLFLGETFFGPLFF